MWFQRDKDRLIVRDIPELGQVERFSRDLLAVADERRVRTIYAYGATTIVIEADNVTLAFAPITYVNDGYVEGACARRTMSFEREAA